MELKAREIFAVGTHNGSKFTEADLDAIVSSFAALDLAGRVPLKVGHDGPDARKDPTSQFAAGWVKRVWREGSKLLADMDVPEKVGAWIEDGKLRFVSVELLKAVKASTRVISWVLDAVALLGTDQPAVGTLAPLKSRQPQFEFAARLTFSRATGTDEAQELREQLASALQRNVDLRFAAALDKGDVTPAALKLFRREYGNTGTEADASAFIASHPAPAHTKANGPGRSHHTGDAVIHEGEPDEQIVAGAKSLMEQRRNGGGEPLGYEQAAAEFMRRNPEVARAYWFQNGE